MIESKKTAAVPLGAHEWFERADALEREDAEAALHAYAQAIAADPEFLDAYVNLGRLLHETGRLAQAEQIYREAVRVCGNSPLLLFNFGVLLDDLDRTAEAVEAYAAALKDDPRLADCHFNLALLYQRIGQPQDAIRHMARYRALVRARSN